MINSIRDGTSSFREEDQARAPPKSDTTSHVHLFERSPWVGGKFRDAGKLTGTAVVYHTPIPEMDPFLSAPKKPNKSPSTENFC
jgi:hypothetical protein